MRTSIWADNERPVSFRLLCLGRIPARRWGVKKSLFAATIAAAGLAVCTTVGHTATFGVNGTSCRLTDAINAANRDTATGGCPGGSGDDTLVLTALAYTLPDGVVLPPITTSIYLNGDPDGNFRRVLIQVKQPYSDIVTVDHSGTLTVRGVNFRNTGSHWDASARTIINTGKLVLIRSSILQSPLGLFNDGTAELYGSSVVQCGSKFGGGGISNAGSLLLWESDVSENGGYFDSQGLVNSGEAQVVNSTIYGNSGAALANSGTLSVVNSTVSGNSPMNGQPLVTNETGGRASFTHVTIAGNLGAGLQNQPGGIVILTNSVVANNVGSDCRGAVRMAGVNLVGDGSCQVLSKGGVKGDPQLGPVMDNGGATRTQALPDSSPARGSADDEFCEITDQREIRRLKGGHCDIGAFAFIAEPSPFIGALIDWYDRSVANGAIVGVGRGQEAKSARLAGVRNQLLSIGELIMQKQADKACEWLVRTRARIDADGAVIPYEYVTGRNAQRLLIKLNGLSRSVGCP